LERTTARLTISGSEAKKLVTSALKGKMMNAAKTNQNKTRKLFRTRRRWHDPMLVFNMSIFNSGSGWNRIFNSISQRENV
jgi:hypothetical protein